MKYSLKYSRDADSARTAVLLKILPYAVLFICLFTSLTVWWMLDLSFKEKADASFADVSEDISRRIVKRLHDHEQVLLGGAALFNSFPSVSREEWRRYVSSLKFDQNLPGILGIGYSAWLTPAEKDENVRAIRAEGFPEYRVKPEGVRPVYTSIVYLEPFNWRNQRAFGYDMYTESVRRAAMDKAIDGGATTVAARIVLVQETEVDKQSGMLMYVPVYRNGEPVDSPEQRRKAFQGFVYSPIRMNDFVFGTLQSLPGDVAFEFYADEAQSPGSLLFDSVSAGKVSIPKGFVPALTRKLVIEAYGRSWSFSFKSLPSFSARFEKGKSYTALAVCLVVSLLLSEICFMLLNARNRAITVEEKTRQDLKALSALLEILHAAMEELPLDKVLKIALDGVGSMPWIDGSGKNFIVLFGTDDGRPSLMSELGDSALLKETSLVCRLQTSGSCQCVFDRSTGEFGCADMGSPVCLTIQEDGPLDSHCCIPVSYGQELLGALNVCFASNVKGREGQTDFLTAVASVLALAIKRIRSAEDLVKALDANRTLVSSIPSMLISLDRKLQIVHLNPAAMRLLAPNGEDFVGKPLSSCGFRWNWEDVSKRLDSMAKGEGPGFDLDSSFPGPEGSEIHVMASFTRISDSSKGGAETLMIADDITERRRLESQLLQAQKLEAIGQLAAGIAHEINTPIQYIGDNVNFLKDSFSAIERHLALAASLAAAQGEGSELSSKLKESAVSSDLDFLLGDTPKALQQSLEGIERIAEIVHALKEFSHPGGKVKAHVDINKALSNVVTVARSEWKYVSEVKTDFASGLPLVPCVLGEINQVFLNLIVNAAHAIEEAVGKTNSKGAIFISTRLDGEMVEIRIRDTGAGIPDLIRNRIFEPFFTTKPVGKGTGQGLPLARSIVVNKHGGQLLFESEVGKGTVFIVRLPLSE